MSFERFSSSDVYIFEHVGGFIECCGCWLSGSEDEDSWLLKLNTPREALAHLDRHEEAGHDIGGARRRIEKEYEDLDAPIEPYVRTPEQEARHQELIKRIFNGGQEDA